MARLIRGEVLSLREREFVQAARVLGMPTRRILVKELLPNLAAPIIISVSLMLPAFVAAEAGLAFLGIGVTSGASWGQTIAKAVKLLRAVPALPVGAALGDRRCSSSPSTSSATRSATPWTPRLVADHPISDADVAAAPADGTYTDKKGWTHEAEQATGARRRCRAVRPRRLWRRRR